MYVWSCLVQMSSCWPLAALTVNAVSVCVRGRGMLHSRTRLSAGLACSTAARRDSPRRWGLWCYQVIPGHWELSEVHVDTAHDWLLEFTEPSFILGLTEEEKQQRRRRNVYMVNCQLVLSSHAQMYRMKAWTAAWNNSHLVTVKCEIYTVCTV